MNRSYYTLRVARCFHLLNRQATDDHDESGQYTSYSIVNNMDKSDFRRFMGASLITY